MSGSLTGLTSGERSGALKFYERIAVVADGHSIDLYLPHQHSDPIEDANLSAREVYKMDEEQVRRAHLMVAEVTRPSLGVGMELEMARRFGVNVVVLGRGDRLQFLRRDPVELTIFGNPAIQATIEYEEQEEALASLDRLLGQRGEDLRKKRELPNY